VGFHSGDGVDLIPSLDFGIHAFEFGFTLPHPNPSPVSTLLGLA